MKNLSNIKFHRITIKNLFIALQSVETEYVKDISPGDFFCNEYALYNWLMEITKGTYDVCFCDVINYRIKNQTFELLRKIAHPLVLWAFKSGGEELRRQLLVYDDYCCGAAMLCRTSKMKYYIEIILNKVIYTEDAIYRLMAYNKEKLFFSHNTFVMYQYGSGIASSGNKKWKNIMYKDMIAVDNIQLSMINNNSKQITHIDRQIINLVRKHYVARNCKLIQQINRIIKFIKLLCRNKLCLRFSSTKSSYKNFAIDLLTEICLK